MGEILFLEVSFRLHDFVASAKSLTDHSRIIYESIHERDKQTYQLMVDRMLINNPVVQFIHKLREMCQHYKLPFVGAEWTLRNGQLTLFLSKKNLLDFNKWNSKAKELLNSYEDKIDLAKVISDYYHAIEAFHNWVQKNFKEINHVEISIIEEYYKKINSLKKDYIIWEIQESLKSPDESKVENLKFALAGCLTTKNKLQLIEHEANDAEWIEGALEIIQSKITLPDDLLERIHESINK